MASAALRRRGGEGVLIPLPYNRIVSIVCSLLCPRSKRIKVLDSCPALILQHAGQEQESEALTRLQPEGCNEQNRALCTSETKEERMKLYFQNSEVVSFF